MSSHWFNMRIYNVRSQFQILSLHQDKDSSHPKDNYHVLGLWNFQHNQLSMIQHLADSVQIWVICSIFPLFIKHKAFFICFIDQLLHFIIFLEYLTDSGLKIRDCSNGLRGCGETSVLSSERKVDCRNREIASRFDWLFRIDSQIES